MKSEALWFWAAAALTGFCLGLGQWAQSRKSKRTTDELQKMVTRLQTLPSDKFLPHYIDTYRIAAQRANTVLLMEPPATLQQVDNAIRLVLGLILLTARRYDDAKPGVEYSANIMIWREKLSDIESTKPLHVTAPVADDSRHSGYLEAMPSLSTTTRGDADIKKADFNPDPNLVALIMPVPSNQKPVFVNNRQKTRILPGATMAYCTKKFVQFSNAREIPKWLDDNYAESIDIALVIKGYFRKGGPAQHVRSFASNPIFSPIWNSRNNRDTFPPAILNLQSNNENILRDNGATLFAPVIEPFSVLLSILLVLRQDAPYAVEDSTSPSASS